jgi:hypothetical protein
VSAQRWEVVLDGKLAGDPSSQIARATFSIPNYFNDIIHCELQYPYVQHESLVFKETFQLFRLVT